jgi:hypothetical protein
MKSNVRLAVAAVALASALVGTAPSGASGAARSRSPSDDLPTFGRPTIGGIQAFSGGTGLEPSLRIDTSGRVYATAPPGSHLWRSLDEGESFKWVPGADPKLGHPPTCDKPTEGDNDIVTDSADRLYFSDLGTHSGKDFASPYNAVARSDDQGATFTFSCDSVNSKDLDRPWTAVDGDPLNGGNMYLAIALVHADRPCKEGKWTISRSPVPGKEAEAGITFGHALKVTGKCQGGGAGPLQVSALSHRVFLPHKTVCECIDRTNSVSVVRCDPIPFAEETPSGLSCVDLPAVSMPGSYIFHWPDLTIDAAGNLFMEWEAMPIDQFLGNPEGDALIYWSSSSDEGDTWSAPVQIPTPGLHNNIFATLAAGDAGRVDLAWYGTDSVDPDFVEGCGGPADVPGDWNLYFAQTLDGLDPTPTFTAPIVASEHFIHRGGIATTFGGHFCGPAQLGDFFRMQVGLDGEANIVYADTNTTNSSGPGLDLGVPVHPMFVRQNGGTGVFVANPIVQGDPAATNSVIDAAGDATYDANGSVSHNQANLDILGSSVSMPDADHYRITIDVADLTTLAPDPTTGNPDTSLDWLVQWFVPSSTDKDGGKNFFAYMESTDGGAPAFWDGEGAANLVPNLPECCEVLFTYPGKNQITGSYTPTAPGTITIDVPVADVTEPGAIDDKLYSVTASTMTLVEPANTIAPFVFEGYWAGGDLFTLIESASSYDFVP